jgi:hypothetical protein
MMKVVIDLVAPAKAGVAMLSGESRAPGGPGNPRGDAR